jgi:hypothetical protein
LTTIRTVVAYQHQHVKLETVRNDSRKSVDQIVPEVGISVANFHSILHDVLNVRRAGNIWCLILLTSDKEGTRRSIFGDLIEMADRDNRFSNKINTGDETWCF